MKQQKIRSGDVVKYKYIHEPLIVLFCDEWNTNNRQLLLTEQSRYAPQWSGTDWIEEVIGHIDLEVLIKGAFAKEGRRYVLYEEDDGSVCCPNCYHHVDRIEACLPQESGLHDYESLEPEYCPYCGTHLDWSRYVTFAHPKEIH